jgi:F-type H+-transporting ATPase subunit b
LEQTIMRTPVYSTLAAGLVSLAVSGTASAKEGGMPQLDYHSFAPQLFWLAIAFVVLYLVMSKLAVPAISDTLDKRQAKIQGDLDAAEKANEDTRALVAAYEKRLADAREEARGLQRGQAEADSALAATRFTELGEKLNGRIAEAEKRIAGQRDTVMAGLEQMAGEIAQSAYAKLAGQPADGTALGAKVAVAAKGTSR